MELVEAVKTLKGNPVKLFDFSRDDLPYLFKDLNYKVGVEVGVYKGEYTKKLLDAGLEIYAVDPWGILTEYPDNRPEYIDRQQFLYAHTLRYLKNYLETGQCKIIRKTSMEAVKDFDIESIDFVYIDANHKFRYIAEDIYEWAKRVKKGGIVAGHDYFIDIKGQIEVKNVVDAYIKTFNIKNWFLVGDKRNKAWKSWFFIKQ